MKVYPPTIMIRSFRGIAPRIAASAYIDPGAHVIGDVTVGENSSIWPTAVLRGDIEPIHIGSETNLQEGTIIHTDRGFPATIGDRVSVGHAAVLHGCIVEDDSLIGIGARVLNGARIGKGAVVAAGALVPEGMEVPPDTLVMGAPAKPRRPVSEEEKARFGKGVAGYVERGKLYKNDQGS
jgi:carbonic anhydrase/acetyltransferase-like protein (isoleucine patch superfamily)